MLRKRHLPVLVPCPKSKYNYSYPNHGPLTKSASVWRKDTKLGGQGKGGPGKNWGKEGKYDQSMWHKIHKEQGRSLQKEELRKKKKVKGRGGGLPSDFNEFLPVPKQGHWPLSKLLALLRNQPCILGTSRGKGPLGGPRRLNSPALAWLWPPPVPAHSELVLSQWALRRTAWSHGSQLQG